MFEHGYVEHHSAGISLRRRFGKTIGALQSKHYPLFVEMLQDGGVTMTL